MADTENSGAGLVITPEAFNAAVQQIGAVLQRTFQAIGQACEEWNRQLAAASTRTPVGGRRVDSLDETELRRAGITVRWNEEPGVRWNEARFYDADGNELEPEHCVMVPASPLANRPPAEGPAEVRVAPPEPPVTLDEALDAAEYYRDAYHLLDQALRAAVPDAFPLWSISTPARLVDAVRQLDARTAASSPLATHSPDDGHPQSASRVVRMDDVEYGYRQTTTNEPMPTSTRSFAEEEVESMAGWPDAAVMVRPVGAWRVAGRDVRGELRWLIDQRAAVPGRPEEGPYPASLDEVADEVAAWVRKLAPSLPGLVVERLAAAEETPEDDHADRS